MKTHSRTFWCETCGAKEPFNVVQLKEHLLSAHGLTGKLTGKKEGIQFLDFEGGYQNNFKITLPGDIVLTEVDEGHAA